MLHSRRQIAFLYLGVGLVAASLGLSAQTQAPRVSTSELARQNMAHVAASVGQIVAILHRDAGLLVELKRWIAKDATDHGQLISDADLADEAIFERLETDISFRSEATRLLQKYGYLLPTLNPESEIGQEQHLLMQQRVRLLAQQTGQQPARQAQTSETNQNCDPLSENCAAPNSALSPSARQPGAPSPNEVPGMQAPQNPNGTPYVPSPQAPPTNDVTELLRTSGQNSLSGDQLRTEGAGGASLEGDESGQSNALSQRSQESGLPGQGSLSGSPLDDLSMNSDFPGSESGGSLNRTASSPDRYSSASGAGTENTSYDVRNNNSAAMENSLRKREQSALGQPLVRRPNPYNDIPSLYDMYLQATPRPPTLERFGMQVFENGTRDLQAIPMDLPVGPEYVLGSGDGVEVDLWGGVSRRFYQVVDREGRISLPEVGPVLVAGKSLADVQQYVQKTLRTQFRDISADVSLARLRTIRVYVVGDVVRPGAYDIGSLSTPLNALFAAGGPTGRGSLRILKHFRGDQLVQQVDVYDLLLHGVKGGIERLENGDTVMVPPLGPEITIEGMVRRPAIYEQNDETSLADAIALSGGLLPTATLRHIEVQRVVAHEKQTMLSLDIPADDTSDKATEQLEAFRIQDGDKIRI